VAFGLVLLDRLGLGLGEVRSLLGI
jgi:hypothetical protein